MLNEINQVLQIVAATAVAISSLFLMRYAKKGSHVWSGTGFALSILCYLISGKNFLDGLNIVYVVILTGAFSVPVFFWLLAKAIFNDSFKPSFQTLLWFLVLLIPRYLQVYLISSNDRNSIGAFLHFTSEIISIGFILAGLYTALKTKQDDLIDERLKFRNLFINISAVIIGLTLIAEIATYGHQAPLLLQVIQRSSILGLTIYFLLRNFEIRPGFFFRDSNKPKNIVSEDPILHSKLLTLLEEQKIYRKEGLTIRELAEIINEQEYRLRRMINGQLGFRNFNDFLNQYRIKDACEILSDSSQNRKTVLEIAYALGYQSIGPFNKAFKEQTGTTPTIFRKTQQKNISF